MAGGKISMGKFNRSASFGMAATKIGLKHLNRFGKRKLTSNLSEEERQIEQLRYEREIGHILFHALNQLKGTALKASQILSLEVDFLPKGVREELAKAYYQATPLNMALVYKVFRREFGENPHDIFQEFDNLAFAAASLGQVHRARLHSGEKVAVKVQYPGIAASIKSDIKLISGLLSILSASTDIIPARKVTRLVIEEIELQLEREVDYEQEARNINWFREKLAMNRILLPEVHEEFSTERVLVMQYLDGQHLDEWLSTKPSQAKKNHYGQLLFDLFLHCFFELGCLHADPHPGNFLFMDDGRLGMIDFGCVKNMSTSFTAEIADFYNLLILHQCCPQLSALRKTYKDMGLIEETLAQEEFDMELQPRLEGMQKWAIEPFVSDEFDFSQKKPIPHMDSGEAKKIMPYLTGMPRDLLYFDRTYHGLVHMLKKIGAIVQTKNPWIGPQHVKEK